MQNSIKVAVGILIDLEGKVLLCQRPSHKSYPLKWEFPGGKVESGEKIEEALRRELREELGIDTIAATPFHQETSAYSDGRTYQVDYFRITAWEGEIVNREFAATEWASPSSLFEYDILEGNYSICAMLGNG